MDSPLKFSFSEKATKICAICLMVLTFMYLVNVKTMRQIAQIIVAFSEKLNFMYLKFFCPQLAFCSFLCTFLRDMYNTKCEWPLPYCPSPYSYSSSALVDSHIDSGSYYWYTHVPSETFCLD